MELKEAEAAERTLDDGWVIMVHPDLESSYQEVTVAAYEDVWKDLGWEKVVLLDEEGYSVADKESEAKADAEFVDAEPEAEPKEEQ